MTVDTGHASATEWQERRSAARRLREMDRNEDLAAWWEREAIGCLRASLAGRYRELIGVPPEQRREFRAALERIRDGGGATVDEVIHRLNFN